ncbi:MULTISPECIES: hypothetical protein [unclassified Bradyrhizobium]|uniref:hypothetical protein n=1 Tax=unclassified Bradyrhizobium TaxID=2631580 RepID=UPI00291692B5|nr:MULTISPECIES: hypothetical protein [unclassified Bradyrhizobium]
MLFYLNCDLPSLESCDQSARDEALRAMLKAYRLGDHAIVIPRKICKFLIDSADLSNAERAILERIGLEFTQRADLPRRASRFVLVSPAKQVGQNQREISVTFDELIQSRVLDRSVLLVENVRRDGLLYSELMRGHFDLHGCPQPACESMHGGGADLKAVFVEQIKNRRIVCGIVDTDQHSPLSNSCSKRDSMVRIAGAMDWPLAFALSPPCREAENCLPMQVVMGLQSGQLNSSNKHFIEIFDAERSLGQEGVTSFWLFVDLKAGISEEILSNIPNGYDRDWLETKLRLIGFDIGQLSIQGYGDKIFDQIASNGRHLSDLRTHTRKSDWRAIFADFMEQLLWIFAGGRRIAT